jgi:hypothetical protein
MSPLWEMLESRLLLSGNGFVGGTAFLDANSNGQLDLAESYLSGAQIALTAPGADNILGIGDDLLVASQVTGPDGAYLFSDIAPGNYRLIETPPAGYVNTGTQALSQLQPVLGQGANFIDVSVRALDNDPASPNPTPPFVNYLGVNNSPERRRWEVVSLSYFGSDPFDLTAGELSVSVGTNSPTYDNISSRFTTFCADLDAFVPFETSGISFPVDIDPLSTETSPPLVTPSGDLPIGLPINAGRMGYLYNHYTSESAIKAGAMSLALYELRYDTTRDLSSGNFRALGPATGWTSPGDFDTMVALANQLIAESAGKNELILHLDSSLDGTVTNTTTPVRQSFVAKGSYNFGNMPAATLGDLVWGDTNANGIQDGVEVGIAGATVTLFTIGGVQAGASQTTVADGLYLFTGLTPGDYYVKVTPPAGYLLSPQDVGSDDAKDSDANVGTGQMAVTTLTSGEDDRTWDAGVYQTATIGDFVWEDLNANGIQEAGEPGISGVTVQLLNAGNIVIATTTTGAGSDDLTTPGLETSGYYEFTGLMPGVSYHVQFVNPDAFDANANPDGYVFSPALQGGNPAVDSNGPVSGNVVLNSGEFNRTIDAGLYRNGSIHAFGFLDINGNGIQDSGDNAFPDSPGKTLVLTGPGGTQTVTTVSGLANWTSLTPGTYTIVENPIPTGYQLTTTPNTRTFTVQSGQELVYTRDAANLPQGDTRTEVILGTQLKWGNTATTPGIKVIKDVVGATVVGPNTPVTFTYSVRNTGGVPLSNIVVTDDNATPGFTGDDFTPAPVVQISGPYAGKNIGDLNGDNLLDTTEVWKYSATVIPPVVMTVTVTAGATPLPSGTLSYVTLSNGNVRVFYRQDNNFNDNTYGTGSDAGWTSQGKTHTFSNLTGSDKAGFLLKYSDGTTLAQFYQDYITLGGSNTDGYAAFSGYQSLGFSGGDGSWVAGSTTAKTWLSDFDSTLETDLNQPGTANNGVAYTAMTVNSPTNGVNNPLPTDPNWDVVDGYAFTISAAAFSGGKNFGGVTIFDQHNSPAKVGGSNTYIPDIKGGASVNTATVTGIGNGTKVTDDDDATVVIVTGPLGSIGDTVWLDANANGVLDNGEHGIAGVQMTLAGTIAGGGIITQTTNTDANGIYHFSSLPAGTYTVTVNTGTLGGTFTETFDLDGPGTPNTATGSLAAGQTRLDLDFGYVPTAPGFSVVKTASAPFVVGGGAVTYTYQVSNNGGTSLSNISLIDDNGTPGVPGDDFAPTYVSGTGNGNAYGLLDPGEVWTYTATTFLPQKMCMTVNGQDIDVGTLTTVVLANGDIQVSYMQSQSVNDNRHGTGATAATGWASGHTFNDLLGSDKAEFRFTDGNGNVVLDFFADYITAVPNSLYGTFPSHYGTLGVTGGDGSMVSGSAGNIVSIHTTMSDTINQSPAFYGFTTNSPTETAPLSNISTPNAGWNYTDGYTVVIKGSTFGAAGFGGVTIPLVHDSPSKLGFNAITPTPCLDSVTNKVTVTATAGGQTVYAFGSADVQVRPNYAPSSIAGTVYQDTSNDGKKGAGEPGLAGVTLNLNGVNVFGESVAATATTDARGNYKFAGLQPGNYTLIETQPAGYADGKDKLGTAGGTLSNDMVDALDIAAGTNATGYLFGELPPASIAGSAFRDNNNNGKRDVGELGIAGVAVQLTGTDGSGNAVSRSTTTDGNGNYVFDILAPGTYGITDTQPAGFIDGKEILGNGGGTKGDDSFTAINLGIGANISGYQFGELLAAQSADIQSSISIVNNKATINLTNTGTGYASLEGLLLGWSTTSGKLRSIKIGGTTVFDTATAGPSANITVFKGTEDVRVLGPGQSYTLVLEFEKNISGLSVLLDMGAGV